LLGDLLGEAFFFSFFSADADFFSFSSPLSFFFFLGAFSLIVTFCFAFSLSAFSSASYCRTSGGRLLGSIPYHS